MTGVLVLAGIGILCAAIDAAAHHLVLPQVQDRPAQPWGLYLWLAVTVWTFL